MERANAFALLVNGADDAAVRKALASLPANDLAAAYEGWRAETLPLSEAPDHVVDSIIEHDIGGFMALAMSTHTAEARREWCDQALVEMANIPVSLVVDAIAAARIKVSFANRFIPFIHEFVEARMDALRSEGVRLERLMRIAHGG